MKDIIDDAQVGHESNDESLPTASLTGLTGKNQTPSEGTRNNLAMIYVIGYLFIVAAILLIGYIKNWEIDNYKDLLLAASGVLSGPLGFIVGYYFKSTKESE